MFKSIIYLRYDKITRQYIYKLVDDDFECEATRNIASSLGAMVAEYQKRNLPVVKNLVLLYLSLYKKYLPQKLQPIIKYIEQEKNWLDKDCPELEYGKKYYHCVLNQIKKLHYIHRQ